MHSTSSTKGFTLVELLVVIAIIGILATIVFVSMGGVRTGARDADRIQDMRNIAQAMELYYSQNNAYPQESDFANVKATIAPEYLGVFPTDPQNGSDYGWVDNSTATGTDTDQAYCIYDVREVQNPVDPNNTMYYVADSLGAREVELSGTPTLTPCGV